MGGFQGEDRAYIVGTIILGAIIAVGLVFAVVSDVEDEKAKTGVFHYTTASGESGTAQYCTDGFGVYSGKPYSTRPYCLDGVRLRKKNGEWATPHIAEQAEMLEELRGRGYAAEFAVGFNDAKDKITSYLYQSY